MNKKRKTLFASACAFALVAASGISLAFVKDTQINETKAIDEAKQIASDIKKFSDKYYIHEGENVEEKTALAIKEVSEYVKGLDRQNKIKSYEISDKSVLFLHNSGISFTFSPSIENTRGDSAPKYALNYMKILTFQPFAQEMSTYDEGPIVLPTDVPSEDKYTTVAASHIANKYDHITYTDEDKSIDETLGIYQMEKLGPNQIVLFQGHGTWIQGFHSCIKTNRDFQWQLYDKDPSYRRDAEEGLIVCHDGCDEYITHKFIDKYVGDLTNSFLYLGFCESAMDDVLANTFLAHGAAAVIANTKSTNVRYNDAMTYEVCDKLATLHEDGSSFTLAEALAEAKTKYGESDAVLKPGAAGSVPTIYGDASFQITHPKIVPYVNLNLTYNGVEQFPMENGVGYTRMGAYGAKDYVNGGYQVDARLDVAGGYVWPDGTDAEWKHYQWNIAKFRTKLSDITAPKAINNIMFDKKAHQLVTAGTSEFGHFEYCTDDGDWTETVPVATAAGKHVVKWIFVGDNNHEDLGRVNDEFIIEVTIAENPVNTGTIIVSVLLIVIFIGAIVVLVLLSKRRNNRELKAIEELEKKNDIEVDDSTEDDNKK